jgi:hypothetical protein
MFFHMPHYVARLVVQVLSVPRHNVAMQAFERAVNLSDNMKTMVGSLLDRLNRLPR